MTVLTGADSSTPQPAQYKGKKVWGVYVGGATPHVWTKEEVAELGAHGVEGVIPIVVPPQDTPWWDENFGYATLEALVREAMAWGLPEGSPLCLDVEEAQAAAILKNGSAADVMHAWAVATRVHNYRTWTYANRDFLANDHWALRWLAEWPEVTPTEPGLLANYQGWQYRGGVDGIDLDIFEEGRDYLTPDLKVVNLPVPAPMPTPDPAAAAANAETKVEEQTEAYAASHGGPPNDVSRETSENVAGAVAQVAIPEPTPPTTAHPQEESAPASFNPSGLIDTLKSAVAGLEAWYNQESSKS